MPGEVGILNVGAGDTKLSFDPSKPEEVARAGRLVKDMLRRGFAILIEVGQDDEGPLYRRAKDFDENTHEYIIAGVPGDEPEIEEPENVEKPAGKAARGRKAGAPAKTRTTRVAAATTNAVAVARTAGG
jgi:hypothetical protein